MKRLPVLILLSVLCGVFLPATASAAVGDLTFVEAKFDGVGGFDGLAGASDAVVSPDGKNVYVASVNEAAVAALGRDPATGRLSFLGVSKDGVGGVDGLGGVRRLAISPDGKHVYAPGSADDAVAIFSRGGDGRLSFVGCVEDSGSAAGCDDQGGQIDGLDRALGAGVSPDGKHVYVAAELDDAVTVFSRNQGTGALELVETEKQGVNGVDGLSGAVGAEVAPDGAHVYTASYAGDAVSVFSRNAQSGALAFVETHEDGVDGVDGLDGGDGPALAPDGRLLYATGDVDDSVAAFKRDPANGRLTFQGAVFDGVNGVDGLNGATLMAISPDGRNLYGPGEFDSALAAFSINPASGLLSFVEAFFDTAGGSPDGIANAEGVAVSPEGTHVYVPGKGDNGIALFVRDVPPTTTITSGPDGPTNDPSPSFGFAASEPSTFECAMDSEAFSACTSPKAYSNLGDGDHSFKVRATDIESNVEDPPAERSFSLDTEADGKASAKKKQKQKGKKIVVKTKVKAGEDLEATAKGKIKLAKKSYKLKPESKSVGSGSSKNLKLKPKKSKHAKRIAKALKKGKKAGKKARAKVTVKMTDGLGNKKSQKLSVKLKR